MSTTVHVENISRQTSEKEVRDFFSFCGKISSISVTPISDAPDASQKASVTFEKETAAKTALLLDNTQLGPAQVHVTSGKSIDEVAGSAAASESKDESTDVAQEDKPRSRIIAEYLANGYTIGDKAIERAIALDQQHGISARFTNALQQFDAKYHASEKAQNMDSKYNITDRAANAWQGLSSYFEKAINTPTGQKLRQFYETSNKQAVDVHNEARHLADLKSGKDSSSSGMKSVPGTDRTKCNCGADTGKCPCEPGKCACSDCAKNPEVESKAGAEEMGMEEVAGSDRTKCNCGSEAGNCPCPPGKCACSSCAKNPEATS